LRSDRPATIFLCLPVGRMERHSRWLRLIVQLTCTVLAHLSLPVFPNEQTFLGSRRHVSNAPVAQVADAVRSEKIC
jgi:hypothetical protein